MAFCNKCGTQNTEDKKFCTNCGNSLVKLSSPTTQSQIQEEVRPIQQNIPNSVTEKKVINPLWWVLGSVVVIGLGVGAYFLFSGNKSEEQKNESVAQSVDTTVVIQPDAPTKIETTTQSIIQGSGDITKEEADEITAKLNSFYEADNNENTDVILGYFAYPIKRYYQTYNVSYEQLKEMFAASFNSKLLSHKIFVNWSGSSVDKIANGYLVKVNATYQFITQKKPDEERTRSFTMIISMNNNKEITSVYENP